jgi:hypothetical protein
MRSPSDRGTIFWARPPAGFLDLYQTAPQSDGNSMRSVIRLKLVDDIFDVEIDSGFGNRQLIGNLFVAMSVSNQALDL